MGIMLSKRGSRLSMLASIAVFVSLLTLLHQLLYSKRSSAGSLQDVADIIEDCNTATQNRIEPAIPNLIHQIWKDTNLSSYSLQASRDSWNDMFGSENYTVKLWTEADVLNLIQTSYPWFLSTYQSYHYDIQRADIARLMVVHKEGGMYADLDAYPKDSSVETISCLQRLGYQAIFAPSSSNGGVSNHFFLAEKNSELLLWALHEAKRRAASSTKNFMLPYVEVFWSTGPMMITAVINDYAWQYNQSKMSKTVGVLSDYFVHYAIHHAAGRYWHKSDGRILNYIADHATSVVIRASFAIGFAVMIVVIARNRAQIGSRVYNILSSVRR